MDSLCFRTETTLIYLEPRRTEDIAKCNLLSFLSWILRCWKKICDNLSQLSISWSTHNDYFTGVFVFLPLTQKGVDTKHCPLLGKLWLRSMFGLLAIANEDYSKRLIWTSGLPPAKTQMLFAIAMKETALSLRSMYRQIYIIHWTLANCNSYLVLPLIGILDNSNLPLNRTNFRFPSGQFIYIFTTDNYYHFCQYVTNIFWMHSSIWHLLSFPVSTWGCFVIHHHGNAFPQIST